MAVYAISSVSFLLRSTVIAGLEILESKKNLILIKFPFVEHKGSNIDKV